MILFQDMIRYFTHKYINKGITITIDLLKWKAGGVPQATHIIALSETSFPQFLQYIRSLVLG